MTYHESVHYSLNVSDSDEWRSLTGHFKSLGRVRLGPEHRVFVLSYFHQLHCLEQLQMSLSSHHDSAITPQHLHHCYNYIRQTLLCDASDALEKGDFMERDLVYDSIGDTVVCRDWEKVFTRIEANFDDWSTWEKSWN